jgi:hypothetical protein
VAEFYKPVCNDMTIHPAHLHWHGLDRSLAVHCRGYSAEQHDIAALVERIETMVKEGKIPEGTVMQCGPGVLSALNRNVIPDFPGLMEPQPQPPDSKIMMSVQVVTTLGPRDWRLVLDYGVIGEDDHGLV